MPFRIVDSPRRQANGMVGVVRHVSEARADREAVEEALVALDATVEEPVSKNAIFSAMKAQGRKMERARCLKLVDQLADDPDSPVIRVGPKFALGE